ncbi:MAG: imelysin family protein, partial [Ketobacter sp.]
FGNGIVDDWEGQLNAWPLDEGLIDYVAASNYHHEMGNVGANANIIANTSLKLGGTTLDLSAITPDLLASLNELGGSEANVATGYHAIEFLLWGQDLNGTKAGAGQRAYTDYIQGDGCTHGNCDRRAQYLKAATELLINDLKTMQAQWAPGQQNYRAELESQKSEAALTKALFGMGSLALGELAGERMKVALEANSTEDEHDCFSDNTHFSHYYDAKGIENIYYGTYQRVDGSVIKGDSIAMLVKAKDPALAKATDKQFKQTMASMQALVDKAEAQQNAQKFDQMIAEGNEAGAKLIQDAITGLVALTRKIEKVAVELGVENLSPETADHEF